MPIFKKIFKNFIIVLAILIGVMVLTFSAMYFFGFAMFGYKIRKATDINTYDPQDFRVMSGASTSNIGYLVYDKIVIETKSIPVFINPTGRDLDAGGQGSGMEISSVSIVDRAWGFVKAEGYDNEGLYSVDVSQDDVTGTVYIKVNEPEGFMFNRGSALRVGIDYGFFDEGKIEIKSETSDVAIFKEFSAGKVVGEKTGNNKYTVPNFDSGWKFWEWDVEEIEVVNNMTYLISSIPSDAKIGEFKFTAMGKALAPVLDINGQSSLVSTVDISNMTVQTNSGSLNLRNILDEAEIITKSATISFRDFVGENLKIRTENSDVIFKNVTGNVEYSGYDTGALRDTRVEESKGGKITGEKVVGSYFVKSKSAATTINEVDGSLNADISGGGSLVVSKFKQGTTESTIKTKSGKVSLGTVLAQSALNVETRNGKVDFKVASAKASSIKVTTQSGAIAITGETDEGTFSGNADITTKSGKINLTKFGSKLNVVATGRGSITAQLTDFVTGSKLTVNSGKLDVKFNKNVPGYILFDGKKDPSVNVVDVKGLKKDGQATAICGASQANINYENAPLITLTNTKGKTTLSSY